jgi:hypothetical protein
MQSLESPALFQSASLTMARLAAVKIAGLQKNPRGPPAAGISLVQPEQAYFKTMAVNG